MVEMLIMYDLPVEALLNAAVMSSLRPVGSMRELGNKVEILSVFSTMDGLPSSSVAVTVNLDISARTCQFSGSRVS